MKKKKPILPIDEKRIRELIQQYVKKKNKRGSLLQPAIITYKTPGETEVLGQKNPTDLNMIIVKVKEDGRLQQKVKTLLHYRERKAKKPVHQLASLAVQSSTQQVIENLGIKILDVPHKPEAVHTLGAMIATQAISMASTMAPMGRIGGSGVLGTIGRSSVDFSVGPTGEVIASARGSKGGGEIAVGKMEKVYPSAPSGGGSSESSTRKPTGEGSTNKTPKKKKNIEVGNTTIFKDEHGAIHFHIDCLKIYITSEIVQQLNVNNQLVQNVVGSQLAELGEELQKKAPKGMITMEIADKDKKDDEDDEDVKPPKANVV